MLEIKIYKLGEGKNPSMVLGKSSWILSLFFLSSLNHKKNSAYTCFSEILTVNQIQMGEWHELEISWRAFCRIQFGL